MYFKLYYITLSMSFLPTKLYNIATTTNKTITTTNANFETYSKDVHLPNLEASHTIPSELLSSLNTQ